MVEAYTERIEQLQDIQEQKPSMNNISEDAQLLDFHLNFSKKQNIKN